MNKELIAVRNRMKALNDAYRKEKDPEKLNIFFKMIIDSIEFVNDYRFYIHLKF